MEKGERKSSSTFLRTLGVEMTEVRPSDPEAEEIRHTLVRAHQKNYQIATLQKSVSKPGT